MEIKKSLFLMLVFITSLTQAEIYQCPSYIDINANKNKDWELVRGEQATGNGEYTGPISAILTVGNSAYEILAPDNSGEDSSPNKKGDFYTVAPETFPVWVMCSYPHVKAAYFKKIKGKFTQCFGPYKQEDKIICQ
jgi:hypothetical protein